MILSRRFFLVALGLSPIAAIVPMPAPAREIPIPIKWGASRVKAKVIAFWDFNRMGIAKAVHAQPYSRGFRDGK